MTKTKTVIAMVGAAMLALCAAQVDAHEGEGGEPAHMGTTPDDDLMHWHDHPIPVDAETQREAMRQVTCAKRLGKLHREWKSADGADAYAYGVMTKRCADQETPAGKRTCERAQRHYESNRTRLMAGVRIFHQRAAEVCTPEEIQAKFQ